MGVVLHRSVNADRTLEVVAERGGRTLRFAGEAAIQSHMDPREPERLSLAYTRALLLPLAWNPAPGRVLLIGLGGGSLVRYLLARLPRAMVTAVDSDPEMPVIARRWFGLPEDPRLAVQVGDGADWLTPGADWDLVLVDAFDAGGPAPLLTDPDFPDRVAAALARGGTAAVNLWAGAADPVLARLSATWPGRVGLVSPPEDRDNRVALGPLPRRLRDPRGEVARELRLAGLLRRMERTEPAVAPGSGESLQ
ncbi:MAG: methyltransferase domain-containing protein [Pseudomonadota bacterium]